jgi:ATP/maltotriose-dependent transcriptional regulator MalT
MKLGTPRMPTSKTHPELLNQLLTHRELEVLYLLCLWGSQQDVMEKLEISRDTMKAHTTKIRKKLGVDTTLQAVLFALRRPKLRKACDEAFG